MGEFSINANNRRFLALFVIFGVPLCKDNPGFGPPGENCFLSLLKVASKYLLAFLEQNICQTRRLTKSSSLAL